MKVPAMVKTAGRADALLVKCGTMLQSPLPLVMRLWRGRSFFLMGKLMNRTDTSGLFQKRADGGLLQK